MMVNLKWITLDSVEEDKEYGIRRQSGGGGGGGALTLTNYYIGLFCGLNTEFSIKSSQKSKKKIIFFKVFAMEITSNKCCKTDSTKNRPSSIKN